MILREPTLSRISRLTSGWRTSTRMVCPLKEVCHAFDGSRVVEIVQVYLKRPIPDPAPEWLKLTPDQTKKLPRFKPACDAKIAEIETEKMAAIGKMLGVG